MTGSARNQIAVNLAFTLLKSAFVLLSIRLADVMLSAQMMGLLLLFRRQGALWGNLVQLGISQTLLRYYVASDDRVHQAQLWSRLLRWIIGAAVLFSVVCTVFAAQITPWLFPDASSAVVVAFGIYVAGIAFGFMAYSSWVAEFKFVESNIVDWLNGSLLFVICLLLGSHLDVTTFTFILAVLTISVSAYSLRRFSRIKGYRLDLRKGDWWLTGEIRHYGLTRALTAFADMATLVIGPWMLRGDPELAGQLIAAYTVLRIVQTLVMPIAQVLALRANSSRYKSINEEKRILLLCAFIFLLAWIGVGLFHFVGTSIVLLWLPHSGGPVALIIGNLLPFVPGMCLFYALRSYIDIRYVRPWNLITLLACVLAFLVVFVVWGGAGIDAAIGASSAMFFVFYIYAALAIAGIVRGMRVKAAR